MSIRHSSGFSTSARREFHGWNSTVDICTAQITLRELGHAQLVGGAPEPREVDLDRLDPVGGARRDPLLVDLLAVDAGREAVQHARPLAQRADDPVADGDVVVREVELRLAALGEVHAVRAGDADRRARRRRARSGESSLGRPRASIRFRPDCASELIGRVRRRGPGGRGKRGAGAKRGPFLSRCRPGPVAEAQKPTNGAAGAAADGKCVWWTYFAVPVVGAAPMSTFASGGVGVRRVAGIDRRGSDKFVRRRGAGRKRGLWTDSSTRSRRGPRFVNPPGYGATSRGGGAGWRRGSAGWRVEGRRRRAVAAFYR